MLHGDGAPYLIDYQDNETHFCYVVMKSDISRFQKFCGNLEEGVLFDYETPYGYGGPLCEGNISEESQKQFLSELIDYAKSEGIVSQFLRFHPLLMNHFLMPLAFETRYLRDTIYIDTESPDLIMKNMDSKNRNMIRKAVKNGVTIERKAISDYAEFLSMYNETMLKDNADDYYIFKKDYFDSQIALENNACIFYAIKDSKPIAGAIMYYNEKYMHYHLAGTHTEYRKFSPSNLMLYEAACWASERGIKQLHLGGGMSADDSLFGFKKQFNKNGRLPFVVGRTIFDNTKYNSLLDLRKSINPMFDTENNRMIQYRY